MTFSYLHLHTLRVFKILGENQRDREALAWQGWVPGSESIPCTFPLSP